MRFLQLLLQLILLLTGYYGEGRKHFGGGKLEVGDERFERQLHCKCTRFTLAYVSIRQHTSATPRMKFGDERFERQLHCKCTRFTLAYVNIRQHTSANPRMKWATSVLSGCFTANVLDLNVLDLLALLVLEYKY
jgi:hypothetical protein